MMVSSQTRLAQSNASRHNRCFLLKVALSQLYQKAKVRNSYQNSLVLARSHFRVHHMLCRFFKLRWVSRIHAIREICLLKLKSILFWNYFRLVKGFRQFKMINLLRVYHRRTVAIAHNLRILTLKRKFVRIAVAIHAKGALCEDCFVGREINTAIRNWVKLTRLLCSSGISDSLSLRKISDGHFLPRQIESANAHLQSRHQNIPLHLAPPRVAFYEAMNAAWPTQEILDNDSRRTLLICPCDQTDMKIGDKFVFELLSRMDQKVRKFPSVNSSYSRKEVKIMLARIKEEMKCFLLRDVY